MYDLRSELHDTRGRNFGCQEDQENSDFKIPCSWPCRYGCFLKWWYPQNAQNTQKWSFLVGTPMVVGETHHFRKPPYDDSRVFMNLFFFQLAFFWRVRLQPSPYLTQPVIFTTGSLPWRKSSPYFLLLEPPETSIFWCFLVDFQSSNSRKNTNTFNFKSFFLQSLKLLNSWEFVVSEFISLNCEAPLKEKHDHVAVKEEKRKSQIVVDSDDERGRWGVRFIERGEVRRSSQVSPQHDAVWSQATFVGGDRKMFFVFDERHLQLHNYAIF